jgi:hypothetical protein
MPVSQGRGDIAPEITLDSDGYVPVDQKKPEKTNPPKVGLFPALSESESIYPLNLG